MDIQVTPVREQIQEETEKGFYILVLRGGTRSSKTYSMLQHILIWLITGKFGAIKKEKGIFSVFRKNKSTLKTTVMRDFEDIINEHELTNTIEKNKTERTFKYGERVVEFQGADDQQKLRGATRDMLYCNEANELVYKEEFFQLSVRTKGQVILDFNPSDENIRINTEIEQKRMQNKGDVSLIVSTYVDNPFLSQKEVEEIENIKDIDPYLREVYGKGGYGKLQGTVFNNYQVIEEVPEEAKYLGHGMDFGFSNDPTTLVAVYRWNDSLVVDEQLYKQGLTTPDLREELRQILPQTGYTIVADSAEPKTIEELQRYGVRVEGAKKGPDSIRHGINLLKGYPLYITGNSYNLLSELRKYTRKLDKEGNATNEPVDAYNHCIDALRYITMTKLNQKKRRTIVI